MSILTVYENLPSHVKRCRFEQLVASTNSGTSQIETARDPQQLRFPEPQ